MKWSFQVVQRGRVKYRQNSDKDRFIIGKHAREMEPAVAVWKFKKDFANINESTVRVFCERYEKETALAKKDQRSTATILPSQKRGQPLMLVKLSGLVQRHTSAANNRGSVISRSAITSTARALLNRYPGVIGEITIEDTFWAKSILSRMSRVRHMILHFKLLK